MAKLTPLQIAQQFALRGDIESAARDLAALQAKGNVGASAALAELAAYQGNWKDFLERAREVFAKPAALETLDVYTDIVKLVARAGAELGDWPEVEGLAKFALTKLGKKDEYETHVDSVRDLAAFAMRKGKGLYAAPAESEAERKAQFDAGIAHVPKIQKRFRTPSDRLDHLYGLASVYGYYPGAVALYDQEKTLPALFDNVVFTASALARVGRNAEAWTAIESSLPAWWPVEDSQIAPVALLTDDAIRQLMTCERCKEVLRTPRGSEARST